MHTAPATSASSANVPPPSSVPAQSLAKGTPSKFQDIYQNLPAVRDQDPSDDEQSANSKSLPGKKRPSDDNTATATTTTTATLTNAILPKARLELTPLLALPTASPALPSDVAATQESAQPSAPASSPAGSAPLAAKRVSTMLTVVAQQSPAPAPVPSVNPTANASFQIAAAGNEQQKSPSLALAAPSQVVPTQITPQVIEASMPATFVTPAAGSSNLATSDDPAVVAGSGEKLQGSPQNPTPKNTAAAPDAIPDGPLPLTAQNLAFTLQLAKTTENSDASAVQPPAAVLKTAAALTATSSNAAQLPVADAPLPAPLASQSAAAGAESKIAITPPAPNAAPSSSLPNISITPSDSRNSASADSASRQPHNPAKEESSQRDSSNSAKPETSTRDQAASGSEIPAASGTLNGSQGTVRQALPASSLWTSGTAQVDARPAASFSAQPAPARAGVTAPMQEVQALIADSPKTGPSSEILLHLDNGQSSAAVRVVDRAGTVNVSVHASDQDLRNTLRSNLSDLTTQLNTQGLRADGLKTASPQNSSENRPDQGGRDQRAPSHQPSPQGDRQSPRERRNSSRWLDELQEQTSADLANSGGKNS